MDAAFEVVVSPDGKRAYVTGQSTRGGAEPAPVYTTIAYSTATGRQLWVSRYHGPGNGEALARSIAVSPNGSTVYVTGQTAASNLSATFYATVAYDAATGRQLWASRYLAVGSDFDAAYSVAVSPSGRAVYVTGQSVTGTGSAARSDYATVAYNSATGRRLWAVRYGLGSGSSGDIARSVKVSPGGGWVYVTGQSSGPASGLDYATVAYNAATGRRLWASRYNGPGNGDDIAYSMSLSPGGAAIFVTGSSYGGAASGYDAATVAYDAATGAQLWASRYNGSATRSDAGASIATGPGGATVYVSGFSAEGTPSHPGFATVAYNAATGAQEWASHYLGPAAQMALARSVAVSQDGSIVYVTGQDYGGSATLYDCATVAYDAATGAQEWASRYNDLVGGEDECYSVAVSPVNGTIIVTGQAQSRSGSDYLSVAYHH